MVGFRRGVDIGRGRAAAFFRQPGRVKDLHFSRAVTEEYCPAGVEYDMAGLARLERGVPKGWWRSIGVPVIAMLFGPDAGIEHPEGASCRHQDMAAVARGVQPVEARELRLAHHFQ